MNIATVQPIVTPSTSRDSRRVSQPPLLVPHADVTRTDTMLTAPPAYSPGSRGPSGAGGSSSFAAVPPVMATTSSMDPFANQVTFSSNTAAESRLLPSPPPSASASSPDSKPSTLPSVDQVMSRASTSTPHQRESLSSSMASLKPVGAELTHQSASSTVQPSRAARLQMSLPAMATSQGMSTRKPGFWGRSSATTAEAAKALARMSNVSSLGGLLTNGGSGAGSRTNRDGIISPPSTLSLGIASSFHIA